MRTASRLLASNVVMWVLAFAVLSVQARTAAQSRRHRRHGADAGLQHGVELHHQHEPAALQRRDGAVHVLAALRDRVAPVRDRRHGHRRVCRRVPRARRQPPHDDRQLLSRLHAGQRAGAAAAGGAGVRPAGVAGRAGDLRRRRRGDDGRRQGAVDRARHGRARGRHQAARHQRRWLLRPQLRASVREPDAAVEPRRDVVDHDHPDGDGVDAGPLRPSPAAGRGAVCHHAGHLRADGGRGHARRGRRQPAADRARRRSQPQGPSRARKCDSARDCRRSGRSRRP